MREAFGVLCVGLRVASDCSALVNLLISILIVSPLGIDIARHDICLWLLQFFRTYHVLDDWTTGFVLCSCCWCCCCVPVIKLKRLGAEVFFLQRKQQQKMSEINSRVVSFISSGCCGLRAGTNIMTFAFAILPIYVALDIMSSCERTWVTSLANHKNGSRINLRAVATFVDPHVLWWSALRARVFFCHRIGRNQQRAFGASVHARINGDANEKWQLK